MKKCVYAGTFDPPTSGHRSVIEKCLKIFDKVVVAVMVNPKKEPFLTAEERVKLLKKLFKDNENVEVCAFSGAAMHISSSLVKNSVKFNKDFKTYIPAEILADFEEILRKKGLNYV